MLEGDIHLVQGVTLETTEGVLALAETHLLQEVGVGGVDLSAQLVVERLKHSNIIVVDAYQLGEVVQRIGLAVSHILM